VERPGSRAEPPAHSLRAGIADGRLAVPTKGITAPVRDAERLFAVLVRVRLPYLTLRTMRRGRLRANRHVTPVARVLVAGMSATPVGTTSRTERHDLTAVWRAPTRAGFSACAGAEQTRTAAGMSAAAARPMTARSIGTASTRGVGHRGGRERRSDRLRGDPLRGAVGQGPRRRAMTGVDKRSLSKLAGGAAPIARKAGAQTSTFDAPAWDELRQRRARPGSTTATLR
jgi:hypothetical protein